MASWGVHLSGFGSLAGDRGGMDPRVGFATPEQGGLHVELARAARRNPERGSGARRAAL